MNRIHVIEIKETRAHVSLILRTIPLLLFFIKNFVSIQTELPGNKIYSNEIIIKSGDLEYFL